MSHDKIEDQDDVSIEDRRRVKLADLHRVEGLLNQAVGRLAEVEKALRRRWSPEQIVGTFREAGKRVPSPRD